jgi:hypothetical protein
MFIIRAIGLSKPYLHLFQETRGENSHSTQWEFTGLQLLARHFPTQESAAVVKAKLVNLMLCTGRSELAHRLRVEPALPHVVAPESQANRPGISGLGIASPETELQGVGIGGLGKLRGVACALVGCVLTLGGVMGCSAPKVAAEAAYRSEARTEAVGSGEFVAGIRAEWN